jgi:hypothetical protein
MPRAQLVAAAAALALTAGCAGHDPAPLPASGQFVAPVSGSKAFVALVSDGRHLPAYVCDGRHTGAWLTGPIHAGRATIASRDGQVRISARLTGPTPTGTVTLTGQAHPFHAVTATGPAGLYRATAATSAGRSGTAGWIRLPDGRQRGTQTGFISGNVGLARPAPPLAQNRTATIRDGTSNTVTLAAKRVTTSSLFEVEDF